MSSMSTLVMDTMQPFKRKPLPPETSTSSQGSSESRKALKALDGDKLLKNLKSNGYIPFDGEVTQVRRNFR